MPIAEKKSRILERIKNTHFILATAHRAENVDDPLVLNALVDTLIHAPCPVVFLPHPRTVRQLNRFSLHSKLARATNVEVLPPAGYLDLLVLMKKCDAILTDSGGLQEEATAPQIRKPVVVFRNRTDRPEAVRAGFAVLAGVTRTGALKALKLTLSSSRKLPLKSPYGNGRAGKKIVSHVLGFGKALK